MPIVPDASVLLCLAFRDEGLDYAMSALDAIVEDGARVPSIFWYELRNALLVSERKGRIAPSKTAAFLALVDELPISIEPLPTETGLLQLARECGLTAYDASYVELALREGIALATLDARLAQAARRSGVAVWERP